MPTKTPLPLPCPCLRTSNCFIRSLWGGLTYYRNFLPEMAHRIHPVIALLAKIVTFDLMRNVDTILLNGGMLDELASPLVFVFPYWNAGDDCSHPFLLNFDARKDGFGAAWNRHRLEAISIILRISAAPRLTTRRTGSR